MKRYINILMVALATMMTSCLTEDPRDQLYEEDIYNNANNIYINAVYNPQNQKSRFQKRKIKKNGKRFVDSLYSLIDLKTI